MKRKSIYLRPIEEGDLKRLHEWLLDPVIGEIMGYLPFSFRQQQDWFKTTLNTDRKFVFAICRVSDDQHIGNCGLGNIDYINRNAMFSIFLYDKSDRGRGAGSEATRLTLEFAFRRLNLHKVFLKTSDYLVEAIEMYKKCGFKEEGRLREHEFKQGRYVDKLMFGILRDEFVTSGAGLDK